MIGRYTIPNENRIITRLKNIDVDCRQPEHVKTVQHRRRNPRQRDEEHRRHHDPVQKHRQVPLRRVVRKKREKIRTTCLENTIPSADSAPSSTAMSQNTFCASPQASAARLVPQVPGKHRDKRRPKRTLPRQPAYQVGNSEDKDERVGGG